MTAHQRKDREQMREQAIIHRFWTAPGGNLTWDYRMERATRTLALAIHFRDASKGKGAKL